MKKRRKKAAPELPKVELVVKEISCDEFWEEYYHLERARTNRLFVLDWKVMDKTAELLLHRKQCRRCDVLAKEYEEVYKKTHRIIQGERRSSDQETPQ